MTCITKAARRAAREVELHEIARNGSRDFCELRQSPEWRAAAALVRCADEIERLRTAILGIESAMMDGAGLMATAMLADLVETLPHETEGET